MGGPPDPAGPPRPPLRLIRILRFFFLGPVGSVLEAASALTEIVTTLVIPEVKPIIVTVVVAPGFID